ncbi:Lachesin [Eumeta japonica]|uniref:Lachesin n=1 Tax=Eumeta variegata TaxID=151549 RepID=A0A4C1UQG3_EUMVA|nr:Lachesin [Eumeta japonica]
MQLGTIVSFDVYSKKNSYPSVTLFPVDETSSMLLAVPEVFPYPSFCNLLDRSVSGAVLQLLKVSRLHMGAYLCIASNGVPPSVSKRVMLVVHFPPIMTIQNQLVGAREGEPVHLECHSEAFPRSINYWTINDQIISQSDKRFEITAVENSYEVDMRLTIKHVGRTTFGTYSCISKNSLGDTDGTIKLYCELRSLLIAIIIMLLKLRKYL